MWLIFLEIYKDPKIPKKVNRKEMTISLNNILPVLLWMVCISQTFSMETWTHPKTGTTYRIWSHDEPSPFDELDIQEEEAIELAPENNSKDDQQNNLSISNGESENCQ